MSDPTATAEDPVMQADAAGASQAPAPPKAGLGVGAMFTGLSLKASAAAGQSLAAAKTAGGQAKMAAQDTSRRTQSWAQDQLLVTVKRTRHRLNAKGWIGSVRIAISIGAVGVHAIAPVVGKVAITAAEASVPDDANEDLEEAEKLRRVDAAITEMTHAIESMATQWQAAGMGGQVGSTISVSLLGCGISISASIDVASITVMQTEPE